MLAISRAKAHRIIAIGLAVCMAIGITGGAAAQDTASRPVILMTVAPGAQGVTRRFFGKVVAAQTVDLAFQVGGQLIEFPAQEGGVIPAGALVAQLDLEPFELQRQQAQLQLEQSERALNRFSQLTVSVSEAQLQDAETQVGLSRVSLRNAEVALENATLSAPFNALVASRNVANFSTVGQGAPVVRLHDMSELRIEIDVPEVLFQRAGEQANITLEAQFPTSERTYPLEVREFNAEASPVGQSFRITLAIPAGAGVTALPGSSVTVIATLVEDAPKILIPASAVKIGNDGSTSVMRFVAGTSSDAGTVEEVAVDLGATRDGLVHVVAGLDPGDEIARAGAHILEDGQSVRRFEGFSN